MTIRAPRAAGAGAGTGVVMVAEWVVVKVGGGVVGGWW